MKHRAKKSTQAAPPGHKHLINVISALPYIIITLATVIYFWEIISSRNFLWEDILYQYYPFHYFLFNSLRHFSIPAWNPFMFAGMPFLADIQTQVFYPLNWLFALISSSNQNYVFWLVELKCILHIVLAGIGFYLLMRELKLSGYAGIISGLTFALSGFMVMHLIHLTLVSTFAWFPLILFFFYRTLLNRKLGDATCAGISLGLSNLAGHPQMTLHIVFATALLFILYLIFNWRNEVRFILKRHLPLFILILIIGFALAAAAYLPAYRYSLHTVRELMTYNESAEISLPPSFFITLFIPKFFGSLTGYGTDSVQYWGSQVGYSYWETALYIGIVPCILALIGILFNRQRLRWQFAILGLIALLLALGRFTPLYRLAFELLPGFNRFRIPARFVGLLTVAIAFLAGLGMDVLVKSKTTKTRLILPGLILLGYGALIYLLSITGVLIKPFSQFHNPIILASALKQSCLFLLGVIITLILFWLRTKILGSTPLFASLLILLTFIDLYNFGHQFNLGTTRPDEFYPHRPFLNHLIQESKQTPFRINARSGNYMVLQRNEGLIWQLELLEGYTPLKLTNFVTFDIPVERRNDLLNVRYRIEIDSVRQTLSLSPNPTGLPRAWLADSYIVIPDRNKILQTLSDTGFDYRRIAILENDPGLVPHLIPDSMPVGSVAITKRSRERLELQVENSRPAILMLSEIFYPEWKARVDQKPAEILCADYCLRALPLDSGKHTVLLWYDRTSINIGIVISILICLNCVAILILTKRKRRQSLK